VSKTDIDASKLKFIPAPNANGPGYASFTFQVQDDGSTANGGVNLDPAPKAMTINVTAVNDSPSFVKGTDVTFVEDSGAQTINGWAAVISAGPADESSQTLNFIVSNDNNALFSTQPAISPAGTLSYQSAAGATGSATVTVS